MWGQLTSGCPRCDELAAGAAPVKWARSRRDDDRQRAAEIRAHMSSERHRSGGCGVVCTFGDW